MAKRKPKFDCVRCANCGAIQSPIGAFECCAEQEIEQVAAVSKQELADILRAEQNSVLRMVYRALSREVAGVESIDLRRFGRWVRKELRSKRNETR